MKFLKYFHVFMFFAVMQSAYSLSNQLTGEKAPLFTTQAVFPIKTKGSKVTYTVGEFNLEKYIGKYKIVLYFYPMDNTPGCTREAQNFRDDIEMLHDHGIIIIGISCDSVKSHMKFQQKYALPFILATDSRWRRTISKKYDAAGFLYSKRKTYLIDKKGFVIHAFDKVDIQSQIDDIIRIFKNN